MDAIRVRGLGKRYGQTWAVRGLDFSVAHGQIVALLGANGAGKTTTIAMILGLLEPTEGEITVFGEPVPQQRYRVLPRMNFSSPYVDLPGRLTVRQNLEVYARLYGVPDRQARIHELVHDLALEPLVDRPTNRLSAGQKTRLALAKALVNRPELLILDEPTASLDPDTADRLRGVLARYARQTGATILMASHNMHEVEQLCDEVLLIQAGRLVERGTPASLIRRYGRRNLEEVFLTIARTSADLDA
jgi:ABC-2 type transport system ATP-binding protein